MKLLTLEGLIGAGKSKQMKLLREALKDTDVVFLEEPVEDWMANDLLQSFYRGELSPVAFQMAVLVSLFGPLISAIRRNPKLIVSERSPYSNFHVFAKANLSGVELAAYAYTFTELMAAMPAIDVTMVFLDTSVDTAMARIRSRDRSSEDTIAREYLALLKDNHETLCASVEEARVLRLDASGTAQETHEALIAYLETDVLQ